MVHDFDNAAGARDEVLGGDSSDDSDDIAAGPPPVARADSPKVAIGSANAAVQLSDAWSLLRDEESSDEVGRVVGFVNVRRLDTFLAHQLGKLYWARGTTVCVVCKSHFRCMNLVTATAVTPEHAEADLAKWLETGVALSGADHVELGQVIRRKHGVKMRAPRADAAQ